MHIQPTPRAASAVIAQMTCAAHGEDTRYAEINGAEHEFSVHFTTEWHRESRYSDTHSSGSGSDTYAQCEIVGAWAEDPETGDVAFAGNRDELAALIGEKLAAKWEADISQDQTDKGEW